MKRVHLGEIACLDRDRIHATLVSTNGFHCAVWRSGGYLYRPGKHVVLDFVIKKHLEPCGLDEVRRLHRGYRTLRDRLGYIVPTALFVATRVDGRDNVVVLAEAVTPWFNIANPVYAEETIPLLRGLPKARAQLEVFLEAARDWQRGEQRVIDLYGLDNLVLDSNRDVRYLDSFEVFFYEDVLHLIDDPDPDLCEKIDISLRRREYLEYVLAEATRP